MLAMTNINTIRNLRTNHDQSMVIVPLKVTA